MEKKKFSFLSADQKTQIHCIGYAPEDGGLRGILQIVHGMVEYIERYEPFMKYLCEQGYLVVGHDHLGHGESVITTEQWGYFAETDSSDILVTDIHTLRTMIQKQYPEIPYFILGHSMGSFLLRKYLYLHGDQLRGAVIMGTGSQPDRMLKVGQWLCRVLAKIHGWNYRSSLIQKLVLGGNDKRFQKENLKNSWLTKDVNVIRAYNASPKCSFCFTLNGFYCLFHTIWEIGRPENLAKMPRKLPLFFVSGEDDPVGNFGKGVKEAYDKYEAQGMLDITWKLYPEDRHEILNELDRQQVYEDLYHWMEVRRTT